MDQIRKLNPAGTGTPRVYFFRDRNFFFFLALSTSISIVVTGGVVPAFCKIDAVVIYITTAI